MMNSFLDSNVIIAYIFSLDSLHDASKTLIFDSDNNYYSFNVKEEVNRVFARKNFEFKTFFSKLMLDMMKLNDVNILGRESLHRSIDNYEAIGNLSNENLHESFEKIWNQFDFGENQEVFLVKLKFNDFINNFESFHRSNRKYLFNKMIFVSSHDKKDRFLLEKIEEENLEEFLHEEDKNILFDANEFCKNNLELKLKFVTADQDFLKAIDILKNHLCFDECIDLLEFSPNN